MKRGMNRFSCVLTLGMFGVVVAIGCTTSQDCACDSPAVVVKVPSAQASEVKSIVGGGAACSGVHAQCDIQGATGCAVYDVTPNAAGTCEVLVTFVDGTSQSASYLFGADAPTCCGDLSGGGQMDVTPPTVLLDSGVD